MTTEILEAYLFEKIRVVKLSEGLVSITQNILPLTELKLPTDYPQPQVPTRRSAHYQLVFSPELTAAIKDLSRQSGATLFATLLTTFKILLHLYTEQEQLFVCSPIANRNRNTVRLTTKQPMEQAQR